MRPPGESLMKVLVIACMAKHNDGEHRASWAMPYAGRMWLTDQSERFDRWTTDAPSDSVMSRRVAELFGPIGRADEKHSGLLHHDITVFGPDI